MATIEFRRKNNFKLEVLQPLPIIRTVSGEVYQFEGIFNGFAVEIANQNDMKKLIAMGCIGKANLSRNYPQFHQQKPKIVRYRIFQKRKYWGVKWKHKPEKIIVVPDSDDDNADYFINLKPQYELDCSGIAETLYMTLEEAFFLLSTLNCLQISYKNEKLNTDKTWNLFQQNDKYFVQNYIIYYYFKSKNWVVKPGVKFGGDFLLYKLGPAFYHASYVVIIQVVDENLKTVENCNKRCINYINLMGLNRLCETAGKELLICEIVWPSSVPRSQVSLEDFAKFSVKTTMMKRWILSKERELENVI